MTDLEKVTQYLNENISHSIWYNSTKGYVYTYFPEFNINYILFKLDNINISYTNDASYTDGYRAISIKMCDVLNHIKGIKREENINKILKSN